jgi:hypothetical protein
MTPAKCLKHELQPGEFADSPRYTEILRTTPYNCVHCTILHFRARVVYWWRRNVTGFEP